MEQEIKIGQKWIHYKNPKHEYEIIAIAKNSETLEEVVVYKALYAGDFPFGQIWTRSKKEFLEKVNFEGKEKNRFDLKE